MRKRARKLDAIDQDLSRLLTNTEETIRVSDCWKRYEMYLNSRRKSQVTINNYRANLRRLFQWLAKVDETHQLEDIHITLASISEDHLELYINYLSFNKEMKSSSINLAIASMQQFWKFASRTYGVKNITHDIQKAKAPEADTYTPTEKDMELVYSSLDLTLFHDLRTFTIIKLMEHTGLRIAEVTSLTLSSIDMHERTVSVLGKGSKRRQVPINTSLHQVLEIWLKTRGDDLLTDALFITETDTKLSTRSISHHLHKVGEHVGLHAFSAHSLRRRFCTQLLRNGVGVMTVCRLLGHSNPSVLSKYFALDEKDTRTAVATLGVRKRK